MNPTTTDREGRIKQKLDEKLQILNSPMNHIHTEHLLDVVNEIVVAELKEEHQRTLKEAQEKIESWAIKCADGESERVQGYWEGFSACQTAALTALADITSKEGEK